MDDISFEDDSFDESPEENYTENPQINSFLGGYPVVFGRKTFSDTFVPIDKMIIDPPFPVTDEELSKATYWKYVDKKLADPTVNRDEVQRYVNQQIEKILNHFQKFESKTLTKEEKEAVSHKNTGFYAPYLPTPEDMEVSIVNLVLEILLLCLFI